MTNHIMQQRFITDKVRNNVVGGSEFRDGEHVVKCIVYEGGCVLNEVCCEEGRVGEGAGDGETEGEG